MSAASNRCVLRPYRVLLVIDRQWRDPSSRVLDATYADTDLLQVAGLLRLWNLPFDVLRLDQQRMEINYFLDSGLEPLYGCILWMCRPDRAGVMSHDWGALRRAVEDYGIPLVALGNTIHHPALADVLGVKSDGGECVATLRPHQPPMTLRGGHPLTAGIEGTSIPDRARYDGHYWRIVRARATTADVLATHDHFDAATVRQVRPDVAAIWIGGDVGMMYGRHLRDGIDLLRRALTWSIGYTLIRPQHDAAMLTMDDPGLMQGRMYAWHSPSLTLDMIRNLMVAPLRRYGARLVINVISGHVDHDRRMIVPTWHQQLTDAFGHRQDLPETRRGIEEGIEAGVFEVQSHGWTHLVPDLESPPGPFHDAAMDGERSENGWYAEFEDRRRGTEVPAIVQEFRMRRGIEAISRDFGQRPISFRVSGSKHSRSLEHHTLRVAAGVGFGAMLMGDALYLPRGTDGVVQVPAGGPRVATCHDCDLFHWPDTIDRMCEKAAASLGAARFIGMEELSAYANARIEARDGQILVTYDGHLGRAFAKTASRWEIAVADWLRGSVASAVRRVHVDGEDAGEVSLTPRRISVPAGLGPHAIGVR